MRFFAAPAFVRGAVFAGYVIDALDRLWQEGADAPRMLSVGLHTRIIGRAARIGGLEQVLKYAKDKGKVWGATRGAIARHWISALPPKCRRISARPPR